MYAIIETGGKQYKVKVGDIIQVEKLTADAGSEFTFNDVLAVSNGTEITFGAPFVTGATVSATVIKEGKAKKLVVYKFKAKKGFHKKKGHRQPYTELKVEKINA